VGGTSLLGRAVVVGPVRVGRVSGVLVDDADAVVGVAVEAVRGGTAGFLPWPAATVEANEAIRSGPHAMLDAGEAAFYLRQGARWLTRDAARPPRRPRSARRPAADLGEALARPLDPALPVRDCLS
jgi:hypothetical protein